MPISFSPNNTVTNYSNLTTIDTQIYRDGVGLLGLRHGTNAQTLRVYNTYASATSGEYGVFDWQTTANTLLIGTEKGSGGGGARPVEIVTGGVPALTLDTSQNATFAAGITAASLPTSGTATGSVCVTSAGALFVKTTTGACL